MSMIHGIEQIKRVDIVEQAQVYLVHILHLKDRFILSCKYITTRVVYERKSVTPCSPNTQLQMQAQFVYTAQKLWKVDSAAIA